MSWHGACASGTSRVLSVASLHWLKMDVPIPAPVECEVRSVIKFLNAQGIAPIEIDRQLCQVYGQADGYHMEVCFTESAQDGPRYHGYMHQLVIVLNLGCVDESLKLSYCLASSKKRARRLSSSCIGFHTQARLNGSTNSKSLKNDERSLGGIYANRTLAGGSSYFNPVRLDSSPTRLRNPKFRSQKSLTESEGHTTPPSQDFSLLLIQCNHQLRMDVYAVHQCAGDEETHGLEGADKVEQTLCGESDFCFETVVGACEELFFRFREPPHNTLPCRLTREKCRHPFSIDD
ncbi:hypothetical protein ANN_09945 [Periplaneta americana]|uniref:Uncharacterized protein n=1 Tax=Periplaneta americana TaxID=6978 RepID=A0ABQ8TP71_PERAM|nr:hypothetical protein ANN_09945 [Periplaneta americana]